SGLLCAIVGANTPDTDRAPTAAVDFNSVRRDIAMTSLPCGRSGPILSLRVSKRPSATSATSVAHNPLSGRARAQKRVDLGAAQCPVVVEISDDRSHERFRQHDGALLVAEIVEQDRQRQLLRALALISPFEAELRQALDLVMLVERLAVHRD